MTYQKIDQLLELMVDRGVTSMSQLEQAGFRSDEISRVVSLMNRNSFKRSLPENAPMGRAAIPSHLQLRS